MVALLIVWLWLLIGAAIGRVMFVRILGDQPRRKPRGRGEDEWTDTFVRAVWAGLACVTVWPLAIPIAIMLAQTGAEKLRAKRERLEAEIARLEREVADA